MNQGVTEQEKTVVWLTIVQAIVQLLIYAFLGKKFGRVAVFSYLGANVVSSQFSRAWKMKSVLFEEVKDIQKERAIKTDFIDDFMSELRSRSNV